MDRLSEEGKELRVGAAAAEDSARWPTQAAGGVRKVLSSVTDFTQSRRDSKCETQTSHASGLIHAAMDSRPQRPVVPARWPDRRRSFALAGAGSMSPEQNSIF